jgi:hypothetical protein
MGFDRRAVDFRSAATIPPKLGGRQPQTFLAEFVAMGQLQSLSAITIWLYPDAIISKHLRGVENRIGKFERNTTQCSNGISATRN